MTNTQLKALRVRAGLKRRGIMSTATYTTKSSSELYARAAIESLEQTKYGVAPTSASIIHYLLDFFEDMHIDADSKFFLDVKRRFTELLNQKYN